MAKRGPRPKTGKMEPPAYTLCETVPDPPASLAAVAGVLWKETAAELFDSNALTVVCLAPLEMYCTAYARARDLNERIEKDGYVVITPKGWAAPNPEVGMAAQQTKLMMALAKEFGFTPGSQSRIAIVPQRDEAAARDPIEAARQALRRKQGIGVG